MLLSSQLICMNDFKVSILESLGAILPGTPDILFMGLESKRLLFNTGIEPVTKASLGLCSTIELIHVCLFSEDPQNCQRAMFKVTNIIPRKIKICKNFFYSFTIFSISLQVFFLQPSQLAILQYGYTIKVFPHFLQTLSSIVFLDIFSCDIGIDCLSVLKCIFVFLIELSNIDKRTPRVDISSFKLCVCSRNLE